MEPAERVKTYAAFAETTRKWIAVMDTKAGFLSAINAGLLSFMWTGARLNEVVPLAKWLSFTASLLSLLALLAALWIIVPRQKLSRVVGHRMGWKSAYHPISFYGYVTAKYSRSDFQSFETEVTGLDNDDFCREALEQHFTVSHIVGLKSEWVSASGTLTLFSLALAGIALLVKTAEA